MISKIARILRLKGWKNITIQLVIQARGFVRIHWLHAIFMPPQLTSIHIHPTLANSPQVGEEARMASCREYVIVGRWATRALLLLSSGGGREGLGEVVPYPDTCHWLSCQLCQPEITPSSVSSKGPSRWCVVANKSTGKHLFVSIN